MARRKRTTNLFRVLMSGLVATVVAFSVLLIIDRLTEFDLSEPIQALVAAYGFAWPLNVGLFVSWSYRVYSRLDTASLRQVTLTDGRNERRPLERVLAATGVTSAGTTNTTIGAAATALLVTVLIAQQTEFRSNPIYIALALATVASSWILMVFSFAQSYLRLGAGGERGAHFRFQFPETPRFSDYLNLALMISASAAIVSSEITSRAAWRVVRSNIVIAFVFNSVIIAMMVSLVFGGLLA